MNTQVDKKSFKEMETTILNISTKENTKGIRYYTSSAKNSYTFSKY